MPAIYLFQRRTLYGGDDLHLLALSTSAVRIFQLVCYSILAYHIVTHVVTTKDDSTIKAAAFTTTLQDDMYLRRRRRLSSLEDSNGDHRVLNLGISLLEYAWMDAVSATQTDDCRHSHLFPLLQICYTIAGSLFGIGSLVLLVQIYRTSSQGCPTFDRHARTETMQVYLEWLFLPLNALHCLIWLLGICAMILGYTYRFCEEDNQQQPSTWFVVIWIMAGVLLLISQGIEIVWNFAYVLALYHHDPHALQRQHISNSSHHSSSGSLVTNYSEALPLQPPLQYDYHELVEQMWADRCQNCCRCLGGITCYIFGGRELYGNGAMNYGDFARAMADYLETRGVLDVVPSDVLVGFLVLQQVQNKRRLQLRHEVLSEQFSYNNSSAGFTNSNNNSSKSLGLSSNNHGSSTQLNNHRANVNAKSPNGMRLQQRTLPPQASANSLVDTTTSTTTTTSTKEDLLMQPLTPQQPSKRPVFLQSMAAGSLNHLDPTENNPHSVTRTNNNHQVTVDVSLPPASPNPHTKPLTNTATMPNAPPFTPNKSFQRLLSEHNHADVAILEEGARYSKYALAIYTWYLYLYVNPITGLPKLCMKACNRKSGCCANHNNNNNENSNNTGGLPHNSASNGGRWEGDNLCEAHKHALLLAAGLENEADLVYVQFKSSFNENPYCILLDHETEAVVVAVRGTFSLEDCITDVLIEPESMEPLGDEFGFAEMARGQYCHGGVLACARNVYRDLKRHGSLDYLLGTKYPHYQLRLVGHSLGAASSTLLGFMLRQTYPTLRCYNYSPPGCTLTWDLAIQCQSWCTSFVLDCEMVPRMSFEALEYLRDESLDLIGRIRVSKAEVARRVVTKTLWCGNQNTPARVRHEFDVEAASTIADEIGELLDDLLLPAGDIPSADVTATSYRQQLEQFQSIQSERRLTRGTRRAIRLFPPGKILHLVKTDEEQNCMVNVAKCVTCCMSNAGSLYTPVWIGNGDLNEIVISPTMGTDHFPDRMVEELQGIVRNFGVAPHHR